MGERWRWAAVRRTSVRAGMSSQPVRRAGSIKSWVMGGDFLSLKLPPGAILSLENPRSGGSADVSRSPVARRLDDFGRYGQPQLSSFLPATKIPSINANRYPDMGIMSKPRSPQLSQIGKSRIQVVVIKVCRNSAGIGPGLAPPLRWQGNVSGSDYFSTFRLWQVQARHPQPRFSQPFALHFT